MSARFGYWNLSTPGAPRGQEGQEGARPPIVTSPAGTAPVRSQEGDTSADRITYERINAPLPLNPDEAHDAKLAENPFDASVSYASSSSSRPGSSEGGQGTSSNALHITPLHPMTPRSQTSPSTRTSMDASPDPDAGSSAGPGLKTAMRHARHFYSTFRRNASDGSGEGPEDEEAPRYKRSGTAFWRAKFSGDDAQEEEAGYQTHSRRAERATRNVSAPRSGPPPPPSMLLAAATTTAPNSPGPSAASLESTEAETSLQRTDSAGSRRSFGSSVASGGPSRTGSLLGRSDAALGDVAEEPNAPAPPPPPPPPPIPQENDTKRAMFLRARSKSVDHLQRLLHISKGKDQKASKKGRKQESAARAARPPTEPRILEGVPMGADTSAATPAPTVLDAGPRMSEEQEREPADESRASLEQEPGTERVPGAEHVPGAEYVPGVERVPSIEQRFRLSPEKASACSTASGDTFASLSNTSQATAQEIRSDVEAENEPQATVARSGSSGAKSSHSLEPTQEVHAEDVAAQIEQMLAAPLSGSTDERPLPEAGSAPWDASFPISPWGEMPTTPLHAPAELTGTRGLLEGLALDEAEEKEAPGSPASQYSQVSTSRRDVAPTTPGSDEHWHPVEEEEGDWHESVAPHVRPRMQRRPSVSRVLEPLNVKTLHPAIPAPLKSSPLQETHERPDTANSNESGSSHMGLSGAWALGKQRLLNRVEGRSNSSADTAMPDSGTTTPMRRRPEDEGLHVPSTTPQSASPLRPSTELDESDDLGPMVPKAMLRPSKSSSLLNVMAQQAQRKVRKSRADIASPDDEEPRSASAHGDAPRSLEQSRERSRSVSAPSEDTDENVPPVPPPPPPPNPLRRGRRGDDAPPLLSHKSAVDLRAVARAEAPRTPSGGEPPMYRSKRNKSQPTLRIADDHEFLKALEQVRSQHQERMALRAQARTARKASMPNLRQVSPVLRRPPLPSRSRASSTASGKGVDDEPEPLPDMPAEAAEEETSQDPVFSTSFLELDSGTDSEALSDSPPSEASNEVEKSEVREGDDPLSTSESSEDESIANELGIGHATGNTPSKPFTNDADWKKEVKGLFLIRELVQTERSYARHLESLLIVVLKWTGTTNTSTRMQTNVLMPSHPSSSTLRLPSNAPPPHLITLRKMLPQLISISRALVYRIEESPSSVGVAHAFIVIRDQLEEVHVAWSGVVGVTLRALRATEASKSKAKGRLGLVPVLPPPGSELNAAGPRRSSSRDDSELPSAALDVASGHDRRPEPKQKPQSKELSPVDVAIMPTQRIPRYSLLLRDLLSNTSPGTPSYETLENALRIVQELGKRCDLASSKTQ